MGDMLSRFRRVGPGRGNVWGRSEVRRGGRVARWEELGEMMGNLSVGNRVEKGVGKGFGRGLGADWIRESVVAISDRRDWA